MQLKVYLIEDYKKRRKDIITFFKEIDAFLKGNICGMKQEVLSKFELFQEKGYDSLEIIPILPDEGKETYSNYEFDENAGWVKTINGILAKQEKRVFLIDLALNKSERACFGNDEDAYRAKTAKSILNYISSSANTKEYLIYESVSGHLKSLEYSVLDMDKNEEKTNVGVWFMNSHYFTKGQAEYEKAYLISVTFRKVLNAMQNCMGNVQE